MGLRLLSFQGASSWAGAVGGFSSGFFPNPFGTALCHKTQVMLICGVCHEKRAHERTVTDLSDVSK